MITFKDFLLEAKWERYVPLFTGGKGTPSSQDEAHIKSAVQILKRDDIIQWYLRWTRYLDWKAKQKTWSLGEFPKYMLDWMTKFENTFQSSEKYFVKNRTYAYSIRACLELARLEHFMSLPIPEIQNFRFSYEDPRLLIRKFEEFESKWVDAVGTDAQWIDMTDEFDNIKEIIKFSDGFSWFDLSVPFCKKEGGAMGHCGNSASYKSSDTILSLRKIKKQGDKILGRPACTFIFNKVEKSLGEMKGRANEKPADVYHKYIVKLLEFKQGDSFLIKNVVGGGYAPEENFSIDDLSESDKEKLFKSRPELKPLLMVYNEEGFSENVKNKILDKLPPVVRNKIKFVENGKGSVRIDMWKNAEDLWGDLPSSQEPKDLKYYKKYVLDGDYLEIHNESDKQSAEDLYYRVSRDPRFKSEGVDVHVKNAVLESEEDDEFEALYELDDRIIDQLHSAVREGYERGTTSAIFEDWYDGIVDLEFIQDETGFKFTVGYDNDNHYTSPIYIKCSIKEMIEVLDSGSIDFAKSIFHSHDFTVEGDMSAPYGGYSEYNEKEAIDAFFETLDI